MGDLIEKLVVAAPAATALIILVMVFIKHIDRRDQAFQEERREHRENLKGIHQACHQHQETIQAEQKIMTRNLENALDHNTKELQRNTNFLAKVTKVNGDD